MRPELDGSHKFSRFNPEVGISYSLNPNQTIYFRYSEASRIPTPIELSCNEETFRVAREFATARGMIPTILILNVDYQTLLWLILLWSKLYQKMRGRIPYSERAAAHGIELFHNDVYEDILFQSTGRGTGIFGNIDKTRRIGGEIKYSVIIDFLNFRVLMFI